MGQIFCACAYDTDKMVCSCEDADKFHANCYAHSGTVITTHYLLKHQPYRVMWGGGYIAINDYLANDFRETDLLGFSTYTNMEDFEACNPDLANKSYYDKVKFIEENRKKWKRIGVWNEAVKSASKNVFEKYLGFLVNHDKKQAINLLKYIELSIIMLSNRELTAIDPIPVLTETGEGTGMALLGGCSNETTEQLAGKWRGDLLQILDKPPEDYEIINCCFAPVWERVYFCYGFFGADKEDRVIKNSNGDLLEAMPLAITGKRRKLQYILAEKQEKGVVFKGVPV